MKPRGAMKGEPYRSGPFVWLVILVATCLLLLQKILWLVVPFLFGLIGYYLLFPLQQRLVLAGMSRDASANTVSVVPLLWRLLSFSCYSRVLVRNSCRGRIPERVILKAACVLSRKLWSGPSAINSFAAKAHLSEQLTQQQPNWETGSPERTWRKRR